jgi:hypothetical protein
MLIFLLSLRYPKTNIPGGDTLQVAEGQGAGHGRLSFLFWTETPTFAYQYSHTDIS